MWYVALIIIKGIAGAYDRNWAILGEWLVLLEKLNS